MTFDSRLPTVNSFQNGERVSPFADFRQEPTVLFIAQLVKFPNYHVCVTHPDLTAGADSTQRGPK